MNFQQKDNIAKLGMPKPKKLLILNTGFFIASHFSNYLTKSNYLIQKKFFYVHINMLSGGHI